MSDFKTKINTQEVSNSSSPTPDFSSVEEGHVFKNYKDLCNTLKLPVYGGCSKTSQLKELERYCEIKKKPNSNAFILWTIYDKPLPKITRGNRTKYCDIAASNLQQFLYRKYKPGTTVYIRRQTMMNILGLHNLKYNDLNTLYYSTGKFNPAVLNMVAADIDKDYNLVQMKYVIEFLNLIQLHGNTVINSAVNYIVKNNDILGLNIKLVHMVVHKNKNNPNQTFVPNIATEEEEQIITTLINSALSVDETKSKDNKQSQWFIFLQDSTQRKTTNENVRKDISQALKKLHQIDDKEDNIFYYTFPAYEVCLSKNYSFELLSEDDFLKNINKITQVITDKFLSYCNKKSNSDAKVLRQELIKTYLNYKPIDIKYLFKGEKVDYDPIKKIVI